MKIIRLTALMLLPLLLLACGGSQPAPEAVSEATPLPTATPPPVVEATLPPPVIVTDGEPAEADATDEAAAPDASADASADASPETPAVLPPWPLDQYGYGIQSHATIGDPAFSMEVVAQQVKMDWVKVQLRWSDVQLGPDQYDWGIWDAIANEAQRQGLYLMFSVVTAPAWTRADGTVDGPPDDYQLYYNFLETMLSRYQGQVQAVEVWNEQNIIREWNTPSGADPQAYVDFLAGAYATIKRVAPEVIVISGALAPTGVHDEFNSWDDFIYLDQMIAADMLQYADCLGVHHNGYNIPPDVAFDETERMGNPEDFFFKGPMTNPHHSWSFKTTLDVYADKVQAVRPEMRLCVTEFGYASSEGYDTFPEGFEYARDNSLEEQAQYIVQAYEQMRASGDVMLTFLFNLDYGNKGGGPTDDNVPYSLVDVNGAPRPAFFAVADMEKQR